MLLAVCYNFHFQFGWFSSLVIFNMDYLVASFSLLRMCFNRTCQLSMASNTKDERKCFMHLLRSNSNLTTCTEAKSVGVRVLESKILHVYWRRSIESSHIGKKSSTASFTVSMLRKWFFLLNFKRIFHSAHSQTIVSFIWLYIIKKQSRSCSHSSVCALMLWNRAVLFK